MQRRVVMLAIVAVVVPALSFAQSLAAAAQKERERRAKSASTLKVLDDESLKSSTARIATEATASSDAAPASGDTSTRAEAPGALAGPRSVSDEHERYAKERFWKGEASRRRRLVEQLERDVRQAERWADPTYAGADAPS